MSRTQKMPQQTGTKAKNWNKSHQFRWWFFLASCPCSPGAPTQNVPFARGLKGDARFLLASTSRKIRKRKLKNKNNKKQKQTRNLINEYDSSVSQPWNADICCWAFNRTRNFRSVQEEPIVLSKLLHGECTIWHNGSWYAKIRQHFKKGEALESKEDQLIDKMTDSPKNTAQWLQQ